MPHFTQPAIAVALAGEGPFPERESVLHLLDLGQFNPRKIRVGTRRRVRRALPERMSLEYHADVSDTDLTKLQRIATTTIARALAALRRRMPPDRWQEVAAQVRNARLITDVELARLIRKGAEDVRAPHRREKLGQMTRSACEVGSYDAELAGMWATLKQRVAEADANPDDCITLDEWKARCRANHADEER